MASLIIVEPPLIFEGGERRRRVALIKHTMVVLEQRQVVKGECEGKKTHILYSGGPFVWKMATGLATEVRGKTFRTPRNIDPTRHAEVIWSKVEAEMGDKTVDIVVLFDQVASSLIFQKLSQRNKALSPGEVVMIDDQRVVTMLRSKSPD